MSLRLLALAACAGTLAACGGGPSAERCQQWDASVREVVGNVQDALPAGAQQMDFTEHYHFVAEDLELSDPLAECVAQGHLAEVTEPVVDDPAPDIAFVDGLPFGAGAKQAVAAMKESGWSCEPAKTTKGSAGKAQECMGRYAKGKALVRLAFRSGRLASMSLSLDGIPKRIEDIMAKTGADVFAARKALIEKVVFDLGTRFGNLAKVEDEVGQGGVRMVWTGSDGSRQARLEFTQRGPSLGFVIRDDAVAHEVAEAREGRSEARAESYFE